jgi:hypothetical protein
MDLELNDFESRLAALLAEAGCVKYSVRDLHRDSKQCRDGIYADDIAHAKSAPAPFFNFIVAEGVAVFTFFEADLGVYVFRCDESELIHETTPFAMTDTNACKSLLAIKYGKLAPDLALSRGLAEYWLSS